MKKIYNLSFKGLNLIVLISLFLYFFINLKLGFRKESWMISEFLINYQTGFIRRGLLGEFIFQLSKLTQISPYYFILFFCISCLIIFIWIFIKKSMELQIPLWVWMSTVLIGGFIFNDNWVRKDIFLLLCLVANLKVISSSSNKYTRILLLNFISIIAILSHENYIFFGILPVILLDYFNNCQNKNIKNFILNTLTFFPIFITCLLCFIYSGTQMQGQEIWDSWNSFSFPYTTHTNIPEAAVDALSKPISYYYDQLGKFYKGTSFGIYKPLGALIAFLISILFSLKIINNSKSEGTKTGINSFALVLAIQFLQILPLFFIAWDTGRWISFIILSSFIIYFYFPENLKNFKPKIPSFEKKIEKIDIRIVYLLTGCVVFIWGFFYYILSTPIGIVINLLAYLTGHQYIVIGADSLSH